MKMQIIRRQTLVLCGYLGYNKQTNHMEGARAMMDNFREDIVTSRNQMMPSILYAICWIFIVIFGLYAVMMFNVLFYQFSLMRLINTILPAAIAVLLFFVKDNVKIEYEYTFTNGSLDFAKVMHGAKRKELGSMRVKNVDACGWVTHQSFQRYINMPGVRKDNWFLNRDANLFYFYFVKDSAKRIIVIEPSKEMADLIRQYAAHGAFQG